MKRILCKEKNSKRRRLERVLLQWVDKWKPSESTIPTMHPKQMYVNFGGELSGQRKCLPNFKRVRISSTCPTGIQDRAIIFLLLVN